VNTGGTNPFTEEKQRKKKKERKKENGFVV